MNKRTVLTSAGYKQPTNEYNGEPIGIYLASSWRNIQQPEIVKRLLDAGFWVYDFRNPRPDNQGFSWRSIDPNWQQWTPEQYRKGMTHPIADLGYQYDIGAVKACDVCLLLQPCGRSAHFELGYAIGRGAMGMVLLAEGQEPELMVKDAALCLSIDEAISVLEKVYR